MATNDDEKKLQDQMEVAFGIGSLPVAVPAAIVGGIVSALDGKPFEEGFNEYGGAVCHAAAAFGRRNAKTIKEAAIFVTARLLAGAIVGTAVGHKRS